MMRSMRNVPVTLVVIAVFACYCTEGFIGMNWGRQSAQRLVPSQVVDLMLQNGIQYVRIYTSQEDIVQAFQGSGIDLTLTIFNYSMPPSQENATEWVRRRYSVLNASNVRTIIIGGIYVFNQGAPAIPPIDYSMRSLHYVQTALDAFQLGYRVKANFVNNFSILLMDKAMKPSAVEFRPDIKDKMMEFLQFLRERDSPFLFEIFPILDLQTLGLDLTFAFADGNSKVVIHDVNGAVYTNVVHWQYDCFAWALEKVNASDIKIVISSIGWPTDGYANASIANARRFYKHLLPMLACDRGTPKRPGTIVDVYINTLTDEPKMPDVKPFMRHWGIYRSNGQPKFQIDLSGQGRDIYPMKVKGIMRMPDRWCVFNGDTIDMSKVNRMVARACDKGDCTTLAPGGSCSKLGAKQSVSYAFNVFFQTSFQDVDVCDFEGLAYVTDEDPSTAECTFPVEVVRGRQIDFAVAAPHRRPSYMYFVFLLYILWGLIFV